LFLQGDVMEVLADWPDNYFDCCVTSPPYWGLRDYGVGENEWPEVTYAPMAGMTPVTVPVWHGCLGLEPTPEMYVAHVVEVFREVRRVLKPEATLWLNIGDSYVGSGKGAWDNKHGGQKEVYIHDSDSPQTQIPKTPSGLKPKDLVGIPWRVALAVQADGWYLRSDIIWSKLNPMPESVTDRPTKAHEYVFLMSKSAKYYYDAAAIAEDSKYPDDNRKSRSSVGNKRMPNTVIAGVRPGSQTYPTRNRRSVWTVATQPFPEAHFATFPPKLIEPCILAGCPVGGVVLDPFMGAGTTALVARKCGRDYIGVELNPEYVTLSERRLEKANV
jgi:DNA modification methylase